MIYGVSAGGRRRKEEGVREGREAGGKHLTPHPEWVVLAACMFGAPSVTNCVDAVDKK